MRLWQKYCKVVSIIVNISAVISAVFLLCACALVTIEIIGRGLFNVSTMISDEYACYFLIGIAFMGGAFSFREGSFINVDILYGKFKPKLKKWIDLILNLMAFVYIIYLINRSFYTVYYSYVNSVVSNTIAHTPLFVPQAFMLIGLCVFLLQMVVTIVDLFVKTDTSDISATEKYEQGGDK